MAWYYRHGELLLYGDAVAHLNIARRVVDSLTPGPLQLGTVWLPLPHLLMLPLIWLDFFWQTGLAGSIASMAAFIAGAVGIYRVAEALSSSTVAGWTAALLFLFNPNLLYMQATAMTEALYLAALIWSVERITAFATALREKRADAAGKALLESAAPLAAGMLIRYDGWLLALVTFLAVAVAIARAGQRLRRQLWKPALKFLLLIALAPAAWLGYNQIVFGNALEFATGQYSARAIAARSSRRGEAPHPGYRDLNTAQAFFARAARLNVAEGHARYWLFSLALMAALVAVLDRKMRPALLLWVPWPFYALSIAYGGVPIFMPEWWPDSYYNVRYGLQLLPAIAVFAALFFHVLRRIRWTDRYVQAVTLVSVMLCFWSYATVWRATPICLREARANSITRVALETAVARQLTVLPADARLMMFSGDHGGALQQAAIPFHRVLNEGNFRLWEQGLASPADSADFIIAIEGDPVAAAVVAHPAGLGPIAVIHSRGQPAVTIYRSHIRTLRSEP